MGRIEHSQMTLLKQKHRRWMAAALASMLLVTAADAQRETEPRPNIVLMLVDDLGYGDVGFMGATKIRTPNIDRLAAEGVYLTDAHAPGAVCQPTRYAVLTGRNYWRAPRTGNGFYFQDNEVLMPQVFRDHGYATAMFGKWHLGWGLDRQWPEGMWDAPISHGPNQAGFDYSFAQASGHEWPPFVFIENDRVYKGNPADPLIITRENPEYWPYAGGQGASHGAAAAHAAYDVTRLDLEIARRAVDWLREQEKPFFVYLPFFAPHVPLMPSEEFKGTSEAGLLGDFIQQLDYAVGIVLDALDELGLAENTLIVFTSDNGGCYIQSAMDAGHHSMGPILGLKGDTWEGGHRVPFIARWPERIPAGTRSDHLLSLTDLFPTFAAASGVTLPRHAAPDGLNQWPLWQQPALPVSIRNEMIYDGRSKGLRHGDWIYFPFQGAGGLFGTFYLEQMGYANSDFDGNTLRPDAPPAQLYNVREDLAQTTNLYHQHPEIVAFLDARFREIMRQNRSK